MPGTLLLLLSHVSRVRLCNPIDGSPPGSSVSAILQARTLEWVAISFSKTVPDTQEESNKCLFNEWILVGERAEVLTEKKRESVFQAEGTASAKDLEGSKQQDEWQVPLISWYGWNRNALRQEQMWMSRGETDIILEARSWRNFYSVGFGESSQNSNQRWGGLRVALWWVLPCAIG